MKRPIFSICALLSVALCVTLFMGWIYTRDRVKASNTKPVAQSKNVPDHVIYETAFRHIGWLNEKATTLERQGQDGSAYRNRYKTFGGISDHAAGLLNQVALDTVVQVKEYDLRAKKIISDVRAMGTELQQGQKPPDPPAELLQLQRERDAVIMRGWKTLRDGMSVTDYTKFENLVKKEVTSNVTPLIHGSLPKSAQPQLLNQPNQSGGNK